MALILICLLLHRLCSQGAILCQTVDLISLQISFYLKLTYCEYMISFLTNSSRSNVQSCSNLNLPLPTPVGAIRQGQLKQSLCPHLITGNGSTVF
jgi:hypothetical protein